MRRLILFLVMFLACTCWVQAKTYVVCIGVADYPSKGKDLHLCVNDAQSVKDLYEKNKNADACLLKNEQATISNVCSAMQKYFLQSGVDDAIVFFFSGHGCPGSFSCYDGELKYEIIKEIMNNSKAARKIVFADACYAGKARSSKKRSVAHTSTDVMFFLSSRTNEMSIEYTSWKHGLFTAYLTKGLRGGADENRDRVITAKELFNYVSKGVAEASKDEQHPVMWGNFDGNMPLMVW